MGKARLFRRAAGLVGAIAALSLVLASAASAAAPPYSISVTQFGKTVSGVAPSTATGVTVNLLRNSRDNNGVVTANKIDSCTATPSSQAWSCSFATYPFTLSDDQVQVNYAGTIANDPPTVAGTATNAPSATQITLASSGSLDVPGSTTRDTSDNFVNETIGLPGDGDTWVDYQGKTANCFDGSWCDATYFYYNGTSETSTSLGFSASVASGTPQSTAGTLSPETLTFSTPVTGSQPLAVTETNVIEQYFNSTDSSTEGGTQINITVAGPQLSIEDPPNTGAPSGTLSINHEVTGLPSCTAHLVLSEVTCSNLTPGPSKTAASYTLTDGSTNVAITVPAASQVPGQPAYIVNGNGTDPFQNLFVPNEAGAVVPGLAAGQTVTLSQAGRTLDSITVDPLKFTSIAPLGDLDNGANSTVTGTCATDLFIGSNEQNLCAGGSIPQPNVFETLYGGLSDLSQGAFTGMGSTNVFLPSIYSGLGPTLNTSIFTPFVVTAFPRYNDPITGSGGVNDDNTPSPASGPRPVLPSTASTDPVTYKYAAVNPVTGATGSFVSLGNVNVAGGLTLPPTLPTGWYADQWTVSDVAGDSDTFAGTFYNQGSTTAVIAPAACKASVKGNGLKKATIAKAKKKSKKKKKKVSKTVTVTFSCTGVSGDHVALWIQRGSTVVADGSGTLKAGKAKILASATSGLKKGTYKLIEVTNQNGHSVEADHTLTLK